MTSSGTNTTSFKSSSSLQKAAPSTSLVTLGLEDLSQRNDPSEARYWAQKFGLGTSSDTFEARRKKYAYPRSLTLPAGTAVVQKVVFGVPGLSTSTPLAVVCGPRIGLYGMSHLSAFSRALKNSSLALQKYQEQSSVEPERRIQTGGTVGLCAAFRNDGRLLLVGTQTEVRVADVTNRATLQTVQSACPIRTVAWMRSGRDFVGAGDDGVLRLYNLSAGSSPHELMGHGDSIRACVIWQPPSLAQPPLKKAKTSPMSTTQSQRLVITGSYDHTIRIWNVDNLMGDSNAADQDDSGDRCLAVLSHGAPVEALLLLASEKDQEGDALSSTPPWLLSAGGTTVKVWNIHTGECINTVQAQHRKTITSLLAIPRYVQGKPKSWRIITAGLDGLIRVHTWNNQTDTDLQQLQYVYGYRLQEPITSMATNERGDSLAIGTSTGLVYMRQMPPANIQPRRKAEPRAGTYAFFQRGQNFQSTSSLDFVVQHQQRKRKLTKYDQALKQFRYGDALDEVLATSQPQNIAAVLEELEKRRGLVAALEHRDATTLEPLLAFVAKCIGQPQYAPLLLRVGHKLVDLYGQDASWKGDMPMSTSIKKLFGKLRNQLERECLSQAVMLELAGQIETYVTAAELEQQFA